MSKFKRKEVTKLVKKKLVLIIYLCTQIAEAQHALILAERYGVATYSAAARFGGTMTDTINEESVTARPLMSQKMM